MKLVRAIKARILSTRMGERGLFRANAEQVAVKRVGFGDSLGDTSTAPKLFYPDSISSFDYVEYRKSINDMIPNELSANFSSDFSGVKLNDDRCSCFFCGERMHAFWEFREGPSDGFFHRLNVEVLQLCRYCGWWVHLDQDDVQFEDVGGRGGGYDDWCEGGFDYERTVHYGALRVFDKTDDKAPVDEVRRFLLAKFEARNNLHPRLFEETVASVFSDFGYDVELTSYHNDGGVDVILEKAGKTFCVQVKRYKNKIGVEEIRAFLGALLLAEQPNGIFVTTSDYTMGAKAASNDAAPLGYSVQLVNHEKLFEYLKCTARPSFNSIDQWRASKPRLRNPTVDTVVGGGNFVAMA
ncbi:MAG: restriction endonuclease [Alphaproteobacteria bacterium]